MRTLFIILIIANAVFFAFGQGVFGTARSQLGKTAESKIPSQLNPELVKLGPGQFQTR
ncbi:MAG: hypothetical protein Q7J51_12410 [Sheuella sp.]|jgi:hypothetical protein|nr:hypothetical protein [Sheuella sp.]